MSENFKALIVNQTEKEFTREIKSIDKSKDSKVPKVTVVEE